MNTKRLVAEQQEIKFATSISTEKSRLFGTLNASLAMDTLDAELGNVAAIRRESEERKRQAGALTTKAAQTV